MGDAFLVTDAFPTLDGGDGHDLLDFSTFDDPEDIGSGILVGVSADLRQGEVTKGQIGGSTLLGNFSLIENAQGSPYADQLQGTVDDNALSGGGHNDFLAGRVGDDTLTGGSGNDVLDGGFGTDVAVFSGAMGDYQSIPDQHP